MICMRRRIAFISAAGSRVTSRPSKADAAGGRLVQAQERAAEGGLAAAALADQAERLAAADATRLTPLTARTIAPSACGR
jgi:hypothetical protein